MIVKSWAAAVIVLALCSGGRASGQTISFLDGFPKATNPQGRQDGKIYFAGTTQFAFGLSPTVTVSVMPKTGGLIQQYTLQLTPVMPSPPGTMTFNFGTAAAPLSTDQLPNNTYSIWAVLGLRNGTTNFSVSAGWASVAITQGAGQTGEAGSLTATGGQNGANQIVGTSATGRPRYTSRRAGPRCSLPKVQGRRARAGV